MIERTAMDDLREFCWGWGMDISKEKFVSKAYFAMVALGHECSILNSRYLIMDGVNYEFIKSRKENRWFVKQF